MDPEGASPNPHAIPCKSHAALQLLYSRYEGDKLIAGTVLPCYDAAMDPHEGTVTIFGRRIKPSTVYAGQDFDSSLFH